MEKSIVRRASQILPVDILIGRLASLDHGEDSVYVIAMQNTRHHAAVVAPADAAGTRARPAESLRSTEFAYQSIKARILENDYRPDQHILEQELADDIGLSRTPVREALIRLAQERLIEVIPRHGIRILPVSPQDVREIFQILTSLESAAVEMLAQRHPAPEEVLRLSAACDGMEAAVRAGDRAAWARSDEDFHLGLLDLCGNPRLADMVMTVWEQSHRVRIFTLKVRAMPLQSTRDHRAVLELILAGDADAARELHRHHRIRGADELMKIIVEYELVNL